MGPSENTLPLSGIRVLEFTHAILGPSAGMILADMGAEVLHIEPPKGDMTRRLKGSGVGYFPSFSRNKKSIAINAKEDAGKDIVYKLVETADVVIENFAPGTMDRLGYTYEKFSEINPKIIYCSLKGFLPGPYEKRTAMDEIVQMMGGLAYMTGLPGKPMRAGTSIVDINGGMFGVIGILLALYDRNRTGKGTFVTSSLFETTAFVMAQHMATSAITKKPVPPMAARVSTWSVYRIWDTADGEQVFVGITSDKHWEQFCKQFDRQDWFEDDRLKTNNDRIDARDWFLPDVEQTLVKYTKDEIIKRCEEGKIPFAPIGKPEDLFDDPHLNQGGRLLETTFPGGEKAKMPRLPFLVGDYDFNKRLDPPPEVGQDTREILESAGFTKEQIDEYVANNIIRTGN
jgi:crotonobetainyl-CoA:carnitine CoA-transferase CaiB-like acyl-CoA transferase